LNISQEYISKARTLYTRKVLSERMPTTTSSSYFNKFAKYAFIAFALTGTAYYAYKQGYLQDDDFDGTHLSPLEDDEKEEEDTEEEEDKEETFDDESVVELERANLKRRGSSTKPPRSPPPPSLSVRKRVKEAEELEGKNGTTSRSEREERKLSKGHNDRMKRGFLNEKKLSSSGLFGDGDDEEDPEKEEEDEEEVPKKATTTKESRKRELAMKSPLQLIYRNIRKDLLISKSFDVSAIEATRSLFHFEPFPGVGVWPVKYDDMKMFPMKSSCSRLIVLSVFDDAPSLAASGTAIVSELSKLMMGFGGDRKDDEEEEEENEGNATKVKQRPMFVCNRAQYHVTMFFFSRPIEGMTREEPVEFLIDGSSVADTQREVAKKNDEEIEPPSTPPPSVRTMEKQPSIPKGLGETVLPDKPKPRVKRSVAQNYDRVLSPPTPLSKIKPPSAINSAENLAHASTPISSTQSKFKRSASGAILDEATKAQEVLQTCEPVELVVDRVVLATSGALLLCFDDVDDSLKKCRSSLASNAVGVRGVQQTSTAHCTLARILPNSGDERLSDFELKQIDQLLTKWTKKLKGAKMTCPKAWYVREERFSSVDGDKVRLRFKE